MIKTFLLTLIVAAALTGCDDGRYCYKGHDDKYTNSGSTFTTFVCDEWRNKAGKYQQ